MQDFRPNDIRPKDYYACRTYDLQLKYNPLHKSVAVIFNETCRDHYGDSRMTETSRVLKLAMVEKADESFVQFFGLEDGMLGNNLEQYDATGSLVEDTENPWTVTMSITGLPRMPRNDDKFLIDGIIYTVSVVKPINRQMPSILKCLIYPERDSQGDKLHSDGTLVPWELKFSKDGGKTFIDGGPTEYGDYTVTITPRGYVTSYDFGDGGIPYNWKDSTFHFKYDAEHTTIYANTGESYVTGDNERVLIWGNVPPQKFVHISGTHAGSYYGSGQKPNYYNAKAYRNYAYIWQIVKYTEGFNDDFDIDRVRFSNPNKPDQTFPFLSESEACFVEDWYHPKYSEMHSYGLTSDMFYYDGDPSVEFIIDNDVTLLIYPVKTRELYLTPVDLTVPFVPDASGTMSITHFWSVNVTDQWFKTLGEDGLALRADKADEYTLVVDRAGEYTVEIGDEWHIIEWFEGANHNIILADPALDPDGGCLQVVTPPYKAVIRVVEEFDDFIVQTEDGTGTTPFLQAGDGDTDHFMVVREA